MQRHHTVTIVAARLTAYRHVCPSPWRRMWPTNEERKRYCAESWPKRNKEISTSVTQTNHNVQKTYKTTRRLDPLGIITQGGLADRAIARQRRCASLSNLALESPSLNPLLPPPHPTLRLNLQTSASKKSWSYPTRKAPIPAKISLIPLRPHRNVDGAVRR